MKDGELIFSSGTGGEATVFRGSPYLTRSQWNKLKANGVDRVTVYNDKGDVVLSKGIDEFLEYNSPPRVTFSESPLTTIPSLPTMSMETASLPIQPTAPTTAIAQIAQSSKVGVQRGALSIFSDWRILLLIVVVVIAVIILIVAIVHYTARKIIPIQPSHVVASSTPRAEVVQNLVL
jgi:hypothetical protein